jgi:hypothetical protein
MGERLHRAIIIRLNEDIEANVQKMMGYGLTSLNPCREYHLDGQSYLHCPKCAEPIEIK